MSREIARAEEAERLLNSQVFKDAVQAVHEEIVRRWRAEEDMGTREELHADQKAVDRIVNQIKKVIDDGRIAVSRQR